jgi:DNA-binding transcriptional LysR family regulator
VDLTSLEIFRAVATELSITRAAQQLGRVPSNVTTRIQQLEEELAAPLFLRDKKRLSLSEAGERFLAYAVRILNLADEARQVLKPGEPSGALRIGSMECTVASRLPSPLASFHTTWPKVQIEVSTGPSRHLIEKVLDGRLDCALVALPEEFNDATGVLFEAKPIFREELMLIVPAKHGPVQNAQDLKPRVLAAFPAGCTYRTLAEEWLASGPSNSGEFSVQVVGSYHAMLACVASGACVSVMPRSVLDQMQGGETIEAYPLATIETVLVWRCGFDTPAFDAWRNLLSKFADAAGDR